MKNFYVVLFCLCWHVVVAQSIEIKGSVVEETTQIPVESATVYLNRVKDSSLVNYAISDSKGNFSFKIDKQNAPTVLKVSFVGFRTHSHRFETLDSSINLDKIQLLEDNELDELVIQTEAPPIRIKNDTLEFNAASFRVRPDANVETLIKQLPGVEIDSEGKITVNGKEVNQILVNGKPFFDKDGKVALQSLPSEIINKVQITDTKTKREELTGKAASGNNASINLTIDEDKNKGLFGRLVGGYGTDERYEASTMVNYFRGEQKISLLAMANNINSTGFSMDEIFDNMGGGRNRSMSFSGDGGFSINGMSFGGGQGITESSMIGVNYADEILGEQEFSSSYLFRTNSRENDHRSSSINFLPNGNFLTETTSNSKADNTSHFVKTQLEGKLGKSKKTSYFMQPSFSFGNNKSYISRTQGRWDEDGNQTQSSEGYSESEGDSRSFDLQSNVTRKFKKDNHLVSADFNLSIANNEMRHMNNSENYFYYPEDESATILDYRNQKAKNSTKNLELGAFLEYSIPVVDSLHLSMNLDYSFKRNTDDIATFDFESVDQEYSIRNNLLSRDLELSVHKINPEMGIHIQKKKSSLNLIAGTQISQFEGNSYFLNEALSQKKTFMLPSAHMNFRYSVSRSKNIWANYNFNMRDLVAHQWMPITNYDNPQNQITGNANLNPEQSHDAYVSFRNFDFGTRSGVIFWLGGNYSNDRVVSSTVYDASQRAETTYKNVDNVYNGYVGFTYSWNRKWEAHKLRFGFGARANMSHNVGFINDEEYEADSRVITPTVSLNYDFGEIFSIQPRYELSFSNTDYTNFSRNSTSNKTHRFTTQSTLYWPKGFTLGNDFSYTYNTAIADGYQKGFYLWNISLGYSFWQDQLLAKVKVYDVLNQNVSATRTINENGIFDAENTVLRQYVMFSLTYKFSLFGAPVQKERRQQGRFMFH